MPTFTASSRAIDASVTLSPRLQSAADLALLRIDPAEVSDDLERAALGTRDVHVHAHVVLTRHHLSRTTWRLHDLGVIQRRDDVVLVQRAGLGDRRLP